MKFKLIRKRKKGLGRTYLQLVRMPVVMGMDPRSSFLGFLKGCWLVDLPLDNGSEGFLLPRTPLPEPVPPIIVTDYLLGGHFIYHTRMPKANVFVPLPFPCLKYASKPSAPSD